jgi:broad-specificity NMP kinase
VKRVLVTGMSGTGKSTVLERLAALGYKTVDTDYGDWHEWIDGPDGRESVWREERMRDLLSTEDAELLFVSGTVSNQGKFYPRFDHVVLLSAPAPVIVERLATRTTNPYGKRPEELAEVLGYVATVEPLLRRRATLEVDTSAPVDRVVAAILAHVLPP